MPHFTYDQQTIINRALALLNDVFTVQGVSFTEPAHTMEYCRLKIGHLEHEVFGVLFLNQRHQLISFVELFRGTINGASVPPREVVKEALAHNAAAVIFTHNHPSGKADPSEADKRLTTRLKDALALMDVRMLDHIVCSSSEAVSFAERGWV